MKFFSKNSIDYLNKVKIKEGREIEGIILLRLISGTVVLELIHYICGFLQIRLDKYLISMLSSHILFSAPLFYLIDDVFKTENLILSLTSGAILVIGIPFLYKYRNRYLA